MSAPEPAEQEVKDSKRIVWWKVLLGAFLVYTQVSVQIKIHVFHDPRYLTPDNPSQAVGFYGVTILLVWLGIWLMDSGIKGKKSKS